MPTMPDELRAMWGLLEDVPVEIDKDGDTVIARDFAKWEKGTSTLAIWQWFDDKCPNGLVRDLMDRRMTWENQLRPGATTR